LPRLAWTVILLFYASGHCWDDRQCHQAQLFSIEMGSRKLFLLRLAWSYDPPNLSLSCGLGMTGACHVTMPSSLLRWDLANFLPRLGLKHDPPDLSLSSS
jgi:hypothetical protein